MSDDVATPQTKSLEFASGEPKPSSGGVENGFNVVRDATSDAEAKAAPAPDPTPDDKPAQKKGKAAQGKAKWQDGVMEALSRDIREKGKKLSVDFVPVSMYGEVVTVLSGGSVVARFKEPVLDGAKPDFEVYAFLPASQVDSLVDTAKDALGVSTYHVFHRR